MDSATDALAETPERKRDDGHLLLAITPEDIDTARGYADASHAPSTRRMYESGWHRFATSNPIVLACPTGAPSSGCSTPSFWHVDAVGGIHPLTPSAATGSVSRVVGPLIPLSQLPGRHPR